MALPPIPPVNRVAAPAALLATGREPLPAPASTLRLVLGTDAAGEWLGRGENGHVYRVAAAGDTAAFQAGQTLLVQVLRSGPPLEVRLLGSVPVGTDASTPAGTEADLPALRPDQAAILRLAAAPSQAKAQAAHWRQLALVRMRQDGTVQPGHSVLAAAMDGAAPEDAEAVVPLRVPSWHGWPLMLWLAPRSRAYTGTNRRARRRQSTRLGLALPLPDGGTVGLLFDVLDQQVGLNMTSTSAKALPFLRDQVGAIAARLGKAGLRLMRCQVRHEPGFSVPPAQARPSALAEHELPLVLFRAATETLEALRPERRRANQFDAAP